MALPDLSPVLTPGRLRSRLSRCRVFFRFLPVLSFFAGFLPVETSPDLAGGGAGGGGGSGASTFGSSKIPIFRFFLVVHVLYVFDDFSPSELLVYYPQLIPRFYPGVE